MYNRQSTGYTGQSAQAGGVVTDPKALAGYNKAFSTMFAPLLSKGYTQQQIVSYLQTLPGPQGAKIQEQLDNATNSILNPDTTLDKVMQGLSLAGSAIGVGLLTGGAIAPALSAAGADAAGSIGALAGNAAAGALGGGAISGLEGQNIGKGALLGAVGSTLGSAAAPAADSLSSATGLPGFASTGLVKAGIGAATSAASGANPLIGAAAAGAGSLAGSAANNLGAGAASNFIGNQVGTFAGGMVGGNPNPNQNGNMPPSGGGSNYIGAAGVGALGASALSGSVGGQGNIGNMALTNTGSGLSTDSSLASTVTGALPGILQGAAGVYGSQNAAQAQTSADANAIGTQQSTLGNINNIWSTQQQLGQGAQTALGSALGTNGQPANYSGFQNMPGYQFAVQQGTQAIQRQAAAMGSAYTPNTAAAVGQYVTGTAAQDYNTYISQLMGAAGLGSTANQGLQTGNQTVGNNISTLQQNQGQAQASGVSGAANAIGGIFGVNGAGTGLIGAAGRGLTGGSGSGGVNSGAPVSGNNPMNYGGQNPNGTGMSTGTASDPYGANAAQYNATNGPTAADLSGSTNGVGNIDPGSIDTSGFDPNNINFSTDLSNFDPSNLNFSSDTSDATSFLGF
jgi:hypothetical protein